MSATRLALAIVQNRLGRVPKPAWCTYLVTYRCNARCGMCDSWRVKPGNEMTVDEVRVVFRKLGRLDVVRVTGGEPFLRPDLAELTAAILEISRPAVLHITTNGSFPDRVEKLVKTCPQARRLRFMVSFDGLAPEHDRNRGRDVTFATAMETVDRLAALRKRYGLEVSANHTVISRQSLQDHESLRAQLGARNVDVHSVLAYADSAMYSVKLRGTRAEHLIVPAGYPLHPALREADVTGFVRRELDHAGRLRSRMLRHGKRYYLRGLLERLEGRADARPRPKCVALRSHIRLLPDGGVPVCQFNTERVGNLLNESLDQIWNLQARDARRWVDACPGCWAECEVVPNAIYTGDILRPLGSAR